MSPTIRRVSAAPLPAEVAQFKDSMHALSVSVDHILALLSLPPQYVTASTLGTRLAEVLTCLHTHRQHSAALSKQLEDLKELVKYMQALSQLAHNTCGPAQADFRGD
jgi:hypothetical protein